MRVSHYTPMQNRPKSSPIKNPSNLDCDGRSKSDHITSNPSKKGWSMGMGTAEAVFPLCEHSQRKCFCALQAHGVLLATVI